MHVCEELRWVAQDTAVVSLTVTLKAQGASLKEV